MQIAFLLAALTAFAAGDWKEAAFGEKSLLLDPRCEPLHECAMGPLVKLGDGTILAADDTQTLISKEDGKTWTPRRLFQNPDKYQCRPERALLGTYRDCFSEAFSDDQGVKWKDIRPSTIEASGSPGLLARLQDGRLVLIWNRYINKKKRTGRRESHFCTQAQAERQRPSYTIVAFGDSTTAPRGPLDVYADLLQEELALQEKAIRVINAGVPGNTTTAARSRFQSDVLDRHPQAVIVQFGINDAMVDVWQNPPATRSRVSLEEYAENLRFFVRSLRDRNAEVFLMTPNPLRWTAKLKSLYGKPPYCPDDPDGLNVILKDYAQAVRRIAQEEKVILIDVFAAFSDPQTHPKHTIDELLLDGMHPNDQGHRLVADLLLHKLQRCWREGCRHPPLRDIFSPQTRSRRGGSRAATGRLPGWALDSRCSSRRRIRELG